MQKTFKKCIILISLIAFAVALAVAGLFFGAPAHTAGAAQNEFAVAPLSLAQNERMTEAISLDINGRQGGTTDLQIASGDFKHVEISLASLPEFANLLLACYMYIFAYAC